MLDNNWQMWTNFQDNFTRWFVRYTCTRWFSVHITDFHLACSMLLHYLVKVENTKMLLILTAYSTNCWHVPEDLKTADIEWLTNILKFDRRCLESAEPYSVEHCCIIAIFLPWFMIIFAPSLFFLDYTFYIVHILGKIISAIFLWQVTRSQIIF